MQAQVLCKKLWARKDHRVGPLPSGAGVPATESSWSRGDDRSTGEGPIHGGAKKEPSLYRTAAGDPAGRIKGPENVGDSRTDRIYLRLCAKGIRGRIT